MLGVLDKRELFFLNIICIYPRIFSSLFRIIYLITRSFISCSLLFELFLYSSNYRFNLFSPSVTGSIHFVTLSGLICVLFSYSLLLYSELSLIFNKIESCWLSFCPIFVIFSFNSLNIISSWASLSRENVRDFSGFL